MTGVWLIQSFPSVEWLKSAVKQKLYDTGMQEWHARVSERPSCNLYTKFKETFQYERYLNILSPNKVRNLRLPVNAYKYDINFANSQTCKLCNALIGDGIHYLLHCHILNNIIYYTVTY
jgi:hypothetical protein